MQVAQNASREDLFQIINQLSQQNSKWAEKFAHLEAQFEWLKKQVFGKKSEKLHTLINDHQLRFEDFDEQSHSAEKTEVVKEHTRRSTKDKGHDSIQLPDDLPVEIHDLDLPEDQKISPQTGAPLQCIGTQVTRKLAEKPGSYYIKEYRRKKYTTPNCPEEGVYLADLPDGILPKSRADESFLAGLIVKKYADHLPHYRISEGLTRQGIQVPRKLLSSWTVQIGELLKPMRDLLCKEILESGYVFMDETPVKVLESEKSHQSHTGFMWLISGGAGPPYKYAFHFKMNRQHAHVQDLLQGYDGVLHSDQYEGYAKYARQSSLIWCPCWAHVRRKFFEAKAGSVELKEWILEQIGLLSKLEQEAWKLDVKERQSFRLDQELPVLDAMLEKVTHEIERGNALPKSDMTKALLYLYQVKKDLKNYLYHPWAKMDNNLAERAIRPLAIGRKNWLFVGNERGGEAAATLISLVQTCRSLKINPLEYFEDILRRFQGHPFNRLEELLPQQWAQEKNLLSIK